MESQSKKYQITIKKTWNHSGKQSGLLERQVVQADQPIKLGDHSRTSLHKYTVVHVVEVK